MFKPRNFLLRPFRAVVTLSAVVLAASQVGCDESASRLLCIGKSEELFIGNRLAPGIVRVFGGEANDSETQLLITRVGKSITDKCDRQGMPWEFHYLDSKIPNAASLPGHIFITTALVDHLKNQNGQVDEDMLAGALAHEIAHVVARHVARAVAEQRFADLAEAGLDLITKRDVTADQNEQFDRKVLLLGYSREHELEADRLGAIYAARAGYSKDGLVRVARVLIGLETKQFDQTPWYFRTHPYGQERLAALQRELPTVEQNVSAVAFQVTDDCKGWWGLANLGVQYVRAKFILKSGAQIQLADSAGMGYPDTVIRVDGQQKTYYKTAGKGNVGLWQRATTVGPNGKAAYTGLVGYSPQTAQAIKLKADALLVQGQTQAAIKQYQRAIELGSSDPTTRAQLAKAYETVGDKAAAQAAQRSVLRMDTRGTVLAGLDGSAADSSVAPNPSKKTKPAITAPQPPKAIRLNDLEAEILMKLNLGSGEGRSWTSNWRAAREVFGEERHQIMAGRLVMGQTREGHWGTLRVDDLGVLVEKYSTQGQYSLGRQHYTVSGGVELYAIDEEHICFLYGNNLGADNADDVVLTKTGMDTFSAHFGAPGRVPWNGMCTTAQSDISVQVNDGTIRVMIAAKCSDQFVDSAKMEQTGAFSFAMTGMRPPHACGIR